MSGRGVRGALGVRGVLKVLAVLVFVGTAACQREPAPAADPASAAARPKTADKEDWSLYSAKPNAQDILVVDKTAIAAAHTDWPLVVAQLMELRRSGETLSVTLRLRNEGVELQKPMFILRDVHVIDTATGTKYDVLQRDGRYLATTNEKLPDRFYRDVDPGETITAQMTFAAPPLEVKIVALEIPNIRPLERLPIQDQ